MHKNDQTVDHSQHSIETLDAQAYEKYKDCVKLNLSHNSLVVIDVMPNFGNLRFLDLKFNKLKCIPRIDGLPALEAIDLSFNEIASVDGLASRSLTRADLSFNKIVLLDGLDKNVNLVHLNVSHNCISEVRPLSAKHNVSLSVGRVGLVE